MKMNALDLHQRLYINPRSALAEIIPNILDELCSSDYSQEDYDSLIKASYIISVLEDDELPVKDFIVDIDPSGEVDVNYILTKIFYELSKEFSFFDYYPQGKLLRGLFMELGCYINNHREDIKPYIGNKML